MQTSYTTKPAIAVEGMIADSRIMKNIVSRFATGVIKAGRGVFRASAFEPSQADGDSAMPGQVVQSLSPAAAVDVDAILASGGASAATAAVWEGAELNGVVGQGTMRPARLITLVLSNHTDWDATNATLTGIDDYGDLVTETLAIPNGGNATVTSVRKYRSVLSLAIPAQTGAGGTFTIGIAALAFTAADFEGVAVYDASIEREADAIAAGVEYGDKVCLPVLDKGAVYVLPEVDVKPGDDVFVRVAVGSGSNLGAFRITNDSSSCVQITGAKWGSKAAAGTPAVLILP